MHLVNNQLSLLAYILWPNHSFMNSHEEVKKKREKSTQSFDAFFLKHFWQMFWPIKSNKNEFVKPFIHEGFASYFYGFVQGDSKWAPDNPQNYLLKYTTFDGHSFFQIFMDKTNTVFPHVVAAATILFWIHKSLKFSYNFLINFPLM